VGEPVTVGERAALEALGYTEEWLSSGLLSRRLLAIQYERLQGGGTKKTARYRSEALTAWREGPGPIPDAQLDAFLALMRGDPDPKLGQAAIAELIRSPRLGLGQLERIAADREILRRHEALIRRTYLTRRMESGVTDELLERVIEFGDAAIQTALIRDPRLTRRQAERLAKQGANPTIRERAGDWVRDRKAWQS
jgi:hypothetical protein